MAFLQPHLYVLQSPGHGALGSLDQPKDARQQLAAASRDKAPTYGNEARQKVGDSAAGCGGVGQLVGCGLYTRLPDSFLGSRELWALHGARRTAFPASLLMYQVPLTP